MIPNESLNAENFEALFKQWYNPLCKMAFRYVGDKKVAEDIVQDVFTNIWIKRQALSFHHSPKAYLYRAVINKAINTLEKNKKTILLSEESWQTFENQEKSDEKLFQNERYRAVHLAILALPPACREVFILSRFEELSNKEISDTLKISVKTVENQMTKALKALRSKLHPLKNLLYTFLW